LLNNSQEPIYFCDEAFTNKAFTALGYDLGFAYILLLCLLFFLFVALLRLNNNSFYQNTSHIFLFVCILVFMLCVETYQFYYLLTIFGRGSIIFDDLKGG
jgi:cell division protein FtsW (lipid II flippase)